jgi:hypothetical protein
LNKCARKNKKLNSQGAYSELRSNARDLIESELEKAQEDPGFPANTGLFLTEDDEFLPVFAPLGAVEKIWSRKGRSGARIVLTKDNYGHRATGVGGIGGIQCEAIDIVAGALSTSKKVRTGNCKTRANFIEDGARIYLTERGDIQHYFALGNASKAVSVSSALKSGIGIKADHTLIIGRERVRIVAGFCKAKGGERLVNLNENVTPRIELAATNDDKAQPAILGDNLVKYLKKMAERIDKLTTKCQSLEEKILRYRTALALHVHSGAGIGYIQTFPDPVLVSNAMTNVGTFFNTTRENIIDTYNNYIEDMMVFGISNEMVGAPEDSKLRSNTVFIGN